MVLLTCRRRYYILRLANIPILPLGQVSCICLFRSKKLNFSDTVMGCLFVIRVLLHSCSSFDVSAVELRQFHRASTTTVNQTSRIVGQQRAFSNIGVLPEDHLVLLFGLRCLLLLVPVLDLALMPRSHRDDVSTLHLRLGAIRKIAPCERYATDGFSRVYFPSATTRSHSAVQNHAHACFRAVLPTCSFRDASTGRKEGEQNQAKGFSMHVAMHRERLNVTSGLRTPPLVPTVYRVVAVIKISIFDDHDFLLFDSPAISHWPLGRFSQRSICNQLSLPLLSNDISSRILGPQQ